MILKLLFFLTVVSALKVDNNEIIKITHCNTQICDFIIYSSWINVKSVKLKINENIHVPNGNLNKTTIKNVKGGVLLTIPNMKTNKKHFIRRHLFH